MLFPRRTSKTGHGGATGTQPGSKETETEKRKHSTRTVEQLDVQEEFSGEGVTKRKPRLASTTYEDR